MNKVVAFLYYLGKYIGIYTLYGVAFIVVALIVTGLLFLICIYPIIVPIIIMLCFLISNAYYYAWRVDEDGVKKADE